MTAISLMGRYFSLKKEKFVDPSARVHRRSIDRCIHVYLLINCCRYSNRILNGGHEVEKGKGDESMVIKMLHVLSMDG